jgi:hypothetical protein
MPPGEDHDSGHESTSVHKPKMRGDLSTLSIQIWSIHVAEFSVRREDKPTHSHLYTQEWRQLGRKGPRHAAVPYEAC